MKDDVLKNVQAIQNEQQLEDRFQYPDQEVALAQLPTFEDGLACEMRTERNDRCR